MSSGAVVGGGAAGAAAAAAIANAVKASGAIVKVESKDFLAVIGKVDKPLVVVAQKAFLSPGYKYLSSYKGLAFFTKSPEPLMLPSNAETVMAQKIWIPS
jgi:hypothetical protein